MSAASDGPAGALFLEPDGVAAASGGKVYVADGRANAIRVVEGSRAPFVAGPTSGRSGFADGAASRALFDRPVGIAVGPEGTLYVADSLNRRIRTIRNGTVATLAGNGTSASVDGPGSTASFTLPKGVAVDSAGNVYVADYGYGIRKVLPDGTVSTMPAPNNKNVFAVAARGSGDSLELAYTDTDGIHLFEGGVHRVVTHDSDREPNGEENTIGHAFGIAIVDADSVVVTDLWTDSVRYVNFEDSPFRPARKMRVLAGGKSEERVNARVVASGPASEAHLRAPYGIAYAGAGRIFVADSGNHVVREIDGLDTRLPIAAKSRGVVFPPKSYRIAVIGDSYLWSDVLWPESIGGGLEAALDSEGRAAGLRLKPHVEVLSTSAGTFASAKDFITTYLADGEADLVIFQYSHIAFDHELANDPSLAGAAWKSILPVRFAALASDLAKQGTKFAVVTIPIAEAVSADERAVARESYANPTGGDDFAAALELERTLVSPHFHTIPLLGAIRAADGLPDSPPLYNVLDHHLSIEGSTVAGRLVADDVLRWKPWSSAKR